MERRAGCKRCGHTWFPKQDEVGDNLFCDRCGSRVIIDVPADIKYKRGMECCLCGRLWTALYPEGATELNCPDCGVSNIIPSPNLKENEC